jgi:hypothetical protein
MWEDIKFATVHCRDIEKLAMVGEEAWEKWMAGLQTVYDVDDQVLRRASFNSVASN